MNNSLNSYLMICNQDGDSRYRLNFENGYLTKREAEVLKYVIVGYSAKKIARILNLSNRTIEAYSNSIKMKFRCSTKAEVIFAAIKNGLAQQLNVF